MGPALLSGSDESYLTGFQLWQRHRGPEWHPSRVDASGVWLCLPTPDAEADTLIRYEPITERDLPGDLEVRTTTAGPVVEERTPDRSDDENREEDLMALLDAYLERVDAESGDDVPARLTETFRGSSDGDVLLALQALRDIAPTRSDDCVLTIVPLANHVVGRPGDAVREYAFAALADLVTYQPDHAHHVAVRLGANDLRVGPAAPDQVNRQAARCVRAIAAADPGQIADTGWIGPLLAVDDHVARADAVAALRTVAEHDPARVRSSVTALLDAPATGPVEFRRDALRTLGAVAVTDADVARRVVPFALRQTEANHDALRRTSTTVLATIAAAHPERVTEHPGRLIPLLDDEDEGVRASTAVALAALAPVTPVKVWPAMHRFVELLDDARPETRTAAARALGHLGATEARRALQQTRDRDPSATVTEAAAEALERL